jgi:mRNA interferase RelE/StbE
MRYLNNEVGFLHANRSDRPANRAKLIRTKIRQYADDASSQANNVKSLVGVDAKRLRVGDFRVIFIETTDTITILDIGPRGGIYE